jgi:hypothetical protein
LKLKVAKLLLIKLAWLGGIVTEFFIEIMAPQLRALLVGKWRELCLSLDL